ncbi:MAG: iron-binding protein [Methylobacter sp.]|nr:MAG: iron-binding protein [Methylobacter sp.]PPD04444.1 MAG: iron-binding protein [Methylobacter sp.]PPD18265.1 MAG: iron-binding protein [Methylobacter sp.]PPD37182.1 MAG: iron-binding protein [Methylomonas sp.]
MSEKSPVLIDVIAGTTYSWCSCGLAETMPICDGTHKQKSDKRSVKFTPEANGQVWLCMCTKTQNPPYCDGSHSHEN